MDLRATEDRHATNALDGKLNYLPARHADTNDGYLSEQASLLDELSKRCGEEINTCLGDWTEEQTIGVLGIYLWSKFIGT